MCTTSNINSDAEGVESMATNLVIGDVPKNNKKEENEKKNEYKYKKFDSICHHCGQKGHMSKDGKAQRNGSYKKFEKAERAIDREGDELVLFSLMRDSKKGKDVENKKLSSWIMSNNLQRLV